MKNIKDSYIIIEKTEKTSFLCTIAIERGSFLAIITIVFIKEKGTII